MAISVRCPGCAEKVKTKDELVGKRIRCPRCGEALTVPPIASGTPNQSPAAPVASTGDRTRHSGQGKKAGKSNASLPSEEVSHPAERAKPRRLWILVPVLATGFVALLVVVVVLAWGRMKAVEGQRFKREVVEWDGLGSRDERVAQEPVLISPNRNPSSLKEGIVNDFAKRRIHVKTLEEVDFSETSLCRSLDQPSRILGASQKGSDAFLGAAPQQTVHRWGGQELVRSSGLMEGLRDSAGTSYLVYLDDGSQLVCILRILRGSFPSRLDDVVPFTPVFDHAKRLVYLVVIQGVRLSKQVPVASMDSGEILGFLSSDGFLIAPRQNDGSFFGGMGIYSRDESPLVIDGIQGPQGAEYVLFLNQQRRAQALAPVKR